MLKSEKEGYRKPEGYDQDLRSRLLGFGALPSGPEGYVMPEGYKDKLKKEIIAKTVQTSSTARIVVMRIVAVAAVILPLLIVINLLQSSITTDSTTQVLAEIPDTDMYEYVLTHADDIEVEDLLQYQFVDDDVLADLPYGTAEEIGSYLEDHTDDLDLELLDEYL